MRRRFLTSFKIQRLEATITLNSITPLYFLWRLISNLKDAGKITGCRSKLRTRKVVIQETSSQNVSTFTTKYYSTASMILSYNSSPMLKMENRYLGVGRIGD